MHHVVHDSSTYGMALSVRIERQVVRECIKES
jgi:hypothetical protein